MKKLATMLFIIFVSLPVYVFAGDGFTTLYNAWFDDRENISNTPFKYKTFVNLANPNNETAVLKISYYDADGTKFANTTSFTHSIPPKGKLNFRPNADLQLDYSSDDIRGSYVIEVTSGAIIGQNTRVVFAGDLLPNLGQEYNLNDPVFTSISHLDTYASNYWMVQGFMQGDFNGNDLVPLSPNDYDSFFYINNPDDKFPALVKINFHNLDGTSINSSPHERTIAPHETLIISPTEYGITGDATNKSFGLVTIEAVNRKVIGFTSKERCLGTLHGNEYQFIPEPFFGTRK